MASPFAVFRKNQQTLLVLLFILAMFAFVILGQLSSEQLSLPLLGMLLGMIVLTTIGVVVKKPLQYAAAGAIGGLLAGYVADWTGFGTGQDSIVVRTSIGNLDRLDVENLLQKRRIANEFIGRAIFKALGEENQFAVQQAAQQFSFGLGGSTEQQMALTLILREEADKMGVSIDSKAVTSYIHLATQNKLNKADFKELLSDLKVSEHTLYDILAEELKVKTALDLLAPPNSNSTPARLWENFKKLEVTQSMQVVAVPVEAFRESVPKPSEQELLAFFEQHKDSYPGTPSPDSVGFRQPRKIQLAYLEASYLEVEQLVADVTDEEVEQYYEENKDILFLNRRVPDFSRGELIEPSPKSDLPDLDLFDPGKPDASLPESGENKEPELPPTPDDTLPAPEKTDADDPPAESKDDSQDADPANPTPEPPQQDSSRRPTQSTLRTVAFLNQEENNEETVKPDNPPRKPDPARPGEKSDSEADPDAPAKPESEPTVPPAPDQPANTVPPAPEDPAKLIPPEPEGPDAERPLVAEKPQPKYQPLDSALRESIRDQLLRDRTRTKQKELSNLVYERMTSLSNDYFEIGTREYNQELTKAAADKVRTKFIQDVREELRKLAKQHSLNYAETPLMDYQEMTESGEHPIGSAVIGEDPAAGGSQSVADKMFGGSPESVYESERATSLDLNSSFAFWKTADVASHVPKFEDEGIRDQVLAAWTELNSRPLAKKRAEELKTKLEKAEAPWSELLAEETITGETEGLVLSTRTTERFSWMRSRSVPSQFGFNMDRAELSTISAVEKADNEFMKTIFLALKEGDVGVVPNFDRSVYYVVKVQDRQPAGESAREAKLTQFLREDLFMASPFFVSPYVQLSGAEENELFMAWRNSLLDRYNVQIREIAME